MARRFVLVAGNIGAGKTALTERVGQALGWHAAYESVADNPYLAEFYADMPAWSFHLQIYFLGQRAEQHLALARGSDSAICDRSIYEDYHIFARALRDLGNLPEREFRAYDRLYQLVLSQLPRPDLLLFLQASVPTLLSRIRGRGRGMESAIAADYLQLLNRYYEEWLAGFDLCPVLSIPADELDFVNQPQHLQVILEKVQEKLSGKEEVRFGRVG